MNRTLLIFISLSLYCITLQGTAEEWKARSIYQLMTDRFARRSDNDTSECVLSKYCGGTYVGIQNHLDYIQDMGFNAIWISPIVENVEGSYHGYGFTNLYTLNENFGSEEEFIAFVDECHRRDIWIMLDVVANHCANTNEDFPKITPFNKPEHYHERCQITDWNNQWMIENCRLCDLPDLKQEDEWVKHTLLDWIHDLVIKYKIDGLRVDTVIEVPKWFWDDFRVAANVFQMGEVFNGNPVFVAGYLEHLDSLFNYPLYFHMKDGFCGNLNKIEEYINNIRPHYPDPSIMGVFAENHDNARFLYDCPDKKKFKNMIAFQLTWEGIPVHYYGGEQYYDGGADPLNRVPLWGHYDTTTDMYQMIKKINEYRAESKFYNEDCVQRWSEEKFYAFTRGKKALICLSITDSVQRTINYHGFSEGDRLCNLLDETDCVTVTAEGINITMQDEPKIYVKQEAEYLIE